MVMYVSTDQISIQISDNDRKHLHKEAEVMGISVAGYARMLLKLGRQNLYSMDENAIVKMIQNGTKI